LPAETPATVRRLIRSCLQKDPRQRLRDIADARLLLDEVEPEQPVVAAPKRAWLPWLVAATGILAAAVAVWQRPKPAEPVTVRFPFSYPQGTGETVALAAAQVAPSPDGRFLAFVASARGQNSLWLRPMGSPTAHRLDKTDGANLPFWSPDGQFLGYFADNKLKKISAAGGPSQTLADVGRGDGRIMVLSGDGGTWNAGGEIVYSGGTGTPLLRTTSAGGRGTPFTKLDEASGEFKHSWPQFLPDGKHVLYFSANRDPAKSGVYVQELGSSNRVLVMKNTTRAAWAPPGYLLYVRDSTLYVQRMDPKSLQLSGEPAPIADDVSANETNGRSAFAVSASGVLVYRGGALSNREAQLTWVDRSGAKLGSIGQPGRYESVRLSPDEKSALLQVGAPTGADTAIMDLTTGVRTPVITDGKASPVLGAWSPDSQRVVINPIELKSLVEFSVSSGTRRQLKAEDLYANDWSPDGAFLVCTSAPGTRLGVLPMDGSAFQVLSDTPYRKIAFRFSPNGKFVAYTSYESGRQQVMVAAFPSFSEKRQVSLAEGRNAVWGKDGRELFFRTGENLMSVEVRTEPRIEAGVPQVLFRLADTRRGSLWTASRDGKRFLVRRSRRSWS
jgi:Tol biopolymer transport system component